MTEAFLSSVGDDCAVLVWLGCMLVEKRYSWKNMAGSQTGGRVSKLRVSTEMAGPRVKEGIFFIILTNCLPHPGLMSVNW